ncbi:MAG TPA: myo-inosose-2 dehydratase [Woeseiaceae bacterium]|nr:myo-inosose-2 dehydratase [Woeseiaceae bacterium]
MSIRIGINPLTWTNDDLPALGDDISLETCLAEAAAAGYAGVELGRKFPREADALGKVLARHNLALVSGWYSLRLLERDTDAEFAAMRPHFELLKALDCDVMVCAEVTGAVHPDMNVRLSRRPQLSSSDFTRFADRLSGLAERMRQNGMRMAYHHHMGTVIQTEEEVDSLMNACNPAVELLLDTGHLTFAGGDPARAVKNHAARIAHLHCKDIRSPVLRRCLNADTSFLEAVLQGVFTVPGDGCIDYAAVLGPLLERNYKGWIVVEAEQDPTVADPVTYATLGFRTLQALAS